MNVYTPCIELYQEDSNILVSSWINDLGLPQEKFDDKILFYNSESILNKQNLLGHFVRNNKKEFEDKNIEFLCKKGENSSTNQDNFFCIIDGNNKFYGIFDGHGINGH